MSEQLCWSLLQPQPAAGHGVQSELPLWRASAQSLQGAETSQGDWGAFLHTCCQTAELSCLSLHTPELLEAALMAEHHSGHREGKKAKLTQETSSEQTHEQLISGQSSSWSCKDHWVVNCPSAGRSEMHTRFSTDANPLSPENISVLGPRHQLCQPLPGIFFSKAYVFFLYFFLHFASSEPWSSNVCISTMPFKCSWPMQQHYKCYTHFLCYINRARWAWAFGCLKRILFLSSTPTLYKRSDFLHNQFSTPMFTKIDKDYTKSTSVHENTWKPEVQEGTIVPKHPEQACQRHCL